MDTLVSVACITYNHEEFIKAAIESFLMQKTNFDFEIIIGEDCSTDDTSKIIEEYANKFPGKVKIVSSNSNVGFMENFKRVLNLTKGKYVAICEGDDYWTDPNKLQKQIDYMENNKECTLCCHAANILDDESKEIIGNIQCCEESRTLSIEEVIINKGGFIATQSIIVRRSLIEILPQWYWNSSVGDYPLQLLAAANGMVYYINDNMSNYRINIKGSWTNNNQKSNDKEVVKRMLSGVIEILDNFDQYTVNKYKEHINEVNIPYKFKRCVLNGEFKSIKKFKVTNYYKTLSRKEIISSYVRAIFPKYYLLNNIIKNKKFNMVYKKLKGGE